MNEFKPSIKLGNFFSKKISRKLALGMFLVSAIPLVIVGYVSFTNSRDILVETTIDELANDVRLHASELDMMLGSFGNDVVFLSRTPPIQGIIRANKNRGIDLVDNTTLEGWKERLGTIFEEISKVNSSYMQVRYIDENGQEIVRVDSDGESLHRISKENLQNKKTRYYFSETMNTAKGALFVSPLDLNREGLLAEIEIPYKPVIRYATPIFDEETNQPKGILIVNIRAESFLSTFNKEGQGDDFLLDKDGFYFINPKKSKEWGSERDLDTGENFKNDFEGGMLSFVLSGEIGSRDMLEHGHVLAYHPVFPDRNNLDNFWTVLEIAPRNVVLAPVFRLRNILFYIATTFVVISIVVSSLFSSTLSKPLRKITKSAREMAQGNLRSKAQVKSTDEIGVLATALNSMADKILISQISLEDQVEERTIELNQKKENLEKQQHAILNILEDIEGEKNATQRTAQELEKFKLAVEKSSDHVVITDPSGIAIYVNNAAELITGFSKEEIIGKKVGTKKSWGGFMDNEFYKKMWDTVLVDKKVFSGEIKNKRKNGQEYFAHTSISPILNKNNEVIFLVGVERDITKEKQVDKAKTEFVSLASHQLRTPLSTVNWYTEMLLDGDAGAINVNQKKYLTEIYKGNQRMVDLVNALLNVSRLELGTFVVEPEYMNIIEMAQSVVDEIKHTVDKKKHTLTFTRDEGLPQILADKKLLRMVFQNLLSNAIKYTPKGGKVTLDVRKVKENIAITVTDTGYGIPKSQQKEIFTKLFRADNIRQMDTEGTGLGLYLIKAIVDHSGGMIWFESEENKGTTFHVTLPLSGMVKKTGSKTLS